MREVTTAVAGKSLISSIAVSSSLLALLAGVFAWLPGLGLRFVAVSLGVFVVAILPLLVLARRHLDTGKFGLANGVTLFRLALTAMLCALLLAPTQPALLWLCIGIATTALLLDGLDGRLARRFDSSSRFGARFDMEVDALLICVLALLAWHFERAGIWVLAAGLLRYIFVAAAVVLPWLRAELPERLRRKTVCILQSTLLLVCMGPIIRADFAPWIAACGVALLVWSFALDIAWLFTNRRGELQS